MGLFSKETCCFCGKDVGALNRKKIADGNYICKDCEKDCSAFIEVSRYDKTFLVDHMAYMKKQDILFKKEVEPLGKKEIDKHNSMDFIDSIAMFEVHTGHYREKHLKELFRYDQIADFKHYTIPNTGSQGKKFAESGIEIKLYSHFDENGFKLPDAMMAEGSQPHPYVALLRIPFDRDTDDPSAGSSAMHHLNELFGRADDSLVGSIKQAFTGTGQQQAQKKAGMSAFKALGQLAKSALHHDEEGQVAAKEQLKEAAVEGMTASFAYGRKYTAAADDAERRAWGQ